MKSSLYHRILLPTLLLASFNTAAHAEDTGCFAHVKQIAEQRASQPYTKTPMMQVDTGRITYDHYQQLKFKGNQTFWRKENLPFQLEFMHPGMHFIHPIELYAWEAGKAIPIKFSKDYFDYSEIEYLKLEADEPRMGFTGFRILSKLGRTEADAPFNETVVFQGASYFRALGQDQRYGLSARGLGLNTSLEGQEEFPDYTSFWLEKPTKQAQSLTFCGLMDSPSLSAATRFVLTPGKATDMEIETQIYPRKNVAEQGVAPLTSMFFHGENSLHQYGDYRPEVHDSDGLLIQKDASHWQWNPLAEVPYFNLQSFALENPKGFGLMQRDRNFDHYQDLEAWYQARPSVWVEPLEDWGKGSVQLLRLHTESDIIDNIVAYWKSDAPQRHLHYKLSWRSDDPTTHKLGKVVATHATNRAVDGLPGLQGRVRFIIDFSDFAPTDTDIPPEADVQLEGKGRVGNIVVQENPFVKGWRVIAPIYPENCNAPGKVQITLTANGNPLSETWSYPIPQELCNAPSPVAH